MSEVFHLVRLVNIADEKHDFVFNDAAKAKARFAEYVAEAERLEKTGLVSVMRSGSQCSQSVACRFGYNSASFNRQWSAELFIGEGFCPN